MAKQKHAHRAHSSLGASSAYRWMSCPGSIRLISEVPPQPSSVYADEGTAAHQVCEKALVSGQEAIAYLGTVERVRENEFEVDEEMVEAVQVYLDAIRGDLEEGDTLLIEKRFSLGFIKDGMFGTNDAGIYKPKTKTLKVYDFKYGQGKVVEVEDNPQLKYYGIGCAYELESPIETVELVIIQPRAYHPKGPVRRWGIPFKKLLDWAQNDLLYAAEATDESDAPLNAGDWCHFCPAAPVCPKQYEQALELAQNDFESLPVEPETLSLERIGEILPKLEVFKKWAAAVEAYALSMAEAGHEVPGYMLTPKRATRKWVDEDRAAAALGVFLDEDELYTKKLVTPAQAEKLLGKKTAADAGLSDFYEAVSSGNKLAPASSNAKPALPSAKADFEKLEIN